MRIQKNAFLFFMFLFSVAVNAQMVLEYDIVGYPTQIVLPLNGGGIVDIDWGDGSDIETFGGGGEISHTYTTTGIMTVTISGSIPWFGGYYSSGVTGMEHLTKVLNWENVGLIKLSNAFVGAHRLIDVPASLPSTVMYTNNMFQDAYIFNGDIGSWNTSAVKDMSYMFNNAKAFNRMLYNWNTSSVTDMTAMFWGATSFNSPIDGWNVSSVTSMTSMFNGASVFNQSIEHWNTSSVTSMLGMFTNARVFNQPIGNWNTAKVKDMSTMFVNASAFNQSLGNWNVSAVTNMTSMLSSLCTDNYDATLIGWSTQTVHTGVVFGGGNSKYSSLSANARAALITNGWTISDAGLGFTNDAKCPNVQTITFNTLPAKTVSDASFDLAAIASSGLAVTYTSSNTAVATVSGNTVTIVGAGSTTITASQAGDATYAPAVDVAQTLTVESATTTSTSGILESNAVELFPNPTSGNSKVQFKNSFENVLITVYSLEGHSIYTKQIGSIINASTDIETNSLTQGVYFVEIKTNQGTLVKRLIKQ